MKTIKILAVAFAVTLVVSCSKEAVINEKTTVDDIVVQKAKPFFNNNRVLKFELSDIIGFDFWCDDTGGNCLPDLEVTYGVPEGVGGNGNGSDKAFDKFKEKVALDRVSEFFADKANSNILFGQMMKRFPKEFEQISDTKNNKIIELSSDLNGAMYSVVPRNFNGTAPEEIVAATIVALPFKF
jgi:hypothetical protein